MIDEAGIIMAVGKHIACQRIQGVNDNMVKSHYHEYYELYYLEYGERYHMVDDKLCLIRSGEFIIFPPYVMHHSYGDSDVRFKRVVLYFSKEAVLVNEALDKLCSSTGVYRSDSSVSQAVLKLLNEILREQENPAEYSENAMQMLLNQLLIKIARHSKEVPEPEKENRITDVLHFIHHNYMDNITLEDLAARFFISQYYLCREFKRCTNSTIVQYINSVRIIHAQRLFMESSKNITEISKLVGFSNVTHFDRVFKNITGMSPSECKKQYRVKKEQA